MPKMTSQQPPQPLPKNSFLNFIEERDLTEWLSLHKKNIVYSLAGLIVLLVLLYVFSSSRTGKNEQEYIQAANDFAFFAKADETQDPALVNDALARLKDALSKHPELHAVYDARLAQIFLNRSQPDEAKFYADATLARIKPDGLPFYTDYAQTTLLISQKDFKNALENAKALQQKMAAALPDAQRAFGDELFALNLLRIALLEQEAGNRTEELRTWQEWTAYAGLSKGQYQTLDVDPEAFRVVIQQLAIGSFSLPDYIAYRENLLKN